MNNIEVKYNTVYEVDFKFQPFLSKQCGQTCLAMITGKSIEKICQELDKHFTTNIYTDLQAYLNDNGYKTMVAKGEFDFEDVPNRSIIRLQKPCGAGHYILKVNDVLLDPAIGEVARYLNDYSVTNYLKYEKIVSS